MNEVDKKWKLREKRDPEESESESEEDNPIEEVEDSIVKVEFEYLILNDFCAY